MSDSSHFKAHTLSSPESSSILSLECDDTYLYAGTAAGIAVWDLATYALKTTLRGHDGGVLCLQIAEDKHWLFSCSSDKSVRIWSTKTLKLLFAVDTTSSGDIFSLAWLPQLHTLYMGSQDATISWITPPESPSHGNLQAATPRHHRFFDSQSAEALARTAAITRSSSSSSIASSPPVAQPSTTVIKSPGSSKEDVRVEVLEVDERHVKRFEHAGYIYALCIAYRNNAPVLVSGSGDEDVKVWACSKQGIELSTTLSAESDAVLALCARDATVFAGHQGGAIKTFQSIRTLKAHNEDILCLSISPWDGDLFSGSATGEVADFDHVDTWQAHDGIILASVMKRELNDISVALITGSSDDSVKMWDVTPAAGPPKPGATGLKGRLFTLLSQFIRYRTVSCDQQREECRQGALWLKKTLAELGADASLLPGAPERNPLVLAVFKANAGPAKKRVLFYGHYDVVESGDRKKWESDPWELSARNEYIYARGVQDNKGPVLAVACAASDLQMRRALAVDVVLLIEGEEEANSTGFQEAVKSHRDRLGKVDVILLSNSSSIMGRPCVTWGLRGVVRATLEVTSSLPDVHSGLSGGAVYEPLIDLTRVLGALIDPNGKITIPAFYDSVRSIDKQEETLLAEIMECRQELLSHSHKSDRAATVRASWREPSLSYHSIAVSGAAHSTVIPARASASISLRIVPDQSLGDIIIALQQHCQTLFESLQSPNKLSVCIDHRADWWLGDPTNEYNRAMARIVEDVWHTAPLWIKEGGSVPGIALLEQELDAEAVHLPMAEANDAGHLPNERIRIISLERGMEIVGRWLEACGG